MLDTRVITNYLHPWILKLAGLPESPFLLILDDFQKSISEISNVNR